MLSLSRLVFFNVACIRYLAFRSLGHRSPLVLCITTLVVVAHRQFRFFAIHSRMFPNFDVQSELLVVTTDDVLFPLLRPRSHRLSPRLVSSRRGLPLTLGTHPSLCPSQGRNLAPTMRRRGARAYRLSPGVSVVSLRSCRGHVDVGTE